MRCTQAIYPHCPKCGRVANVVLWGQDPNTGERTYRCGDCGGRWSVDGVQAELFAQETAGMWWRLQ